MLRLVWTIVLVLLLCPPARADDKNDVKNLLTSRVDAVVALLKNNQMDKTVRNERIIDIVNPIFDFPLMAKLSLGRKYWPGLSDEKKNNFTDLFTRRLQDSYLEKLDLYSDESVIYEDPQQMDNKIHMPTTLVSKDSRISMIYKFYRGSKGWRIYDVVIGGVSIIQTYRSQFDGVLQKGTIDDLLEKLNISGEFTIPAGTENPRR